MEQLVKINNIRLLGGNSGDVTLIVDIDKQSCTRCRETAQKAIDGLSAGKQYSLELQPIRKRRSCDANAYFHLLVGKIAEKTHTSSDEVKRQLVLNYGTPSTMDDGLAVKALLPKKADISQYWKYARFIRQYGDVCEYILYKRTSDMNTAEMSNLIDGTVSDAKLLGIETATPEEIERMKALYKDKFEKGVKTA